MASVTGEGSTVLRMNSTNSACQREGNMMECGYIIKKNGDSMGFKIRLSCDMMGSVNYFGAQARGDITWV